MKGEYTGISQRLPHREPKINTRKQRQKRTKQKISLGSFVSLSLRIKFLAEFLLAVAHEDGLDDANADEEGGEGAAAVAYKGQRQPGDGD